MAKDAKAPVARKKLFFNNAILLRPTLFVEEEYFIGSCDHDSVSLFEDEKSTQMSMIEAWSVWWCALVYASHMRSGVLRWGREIRACNSIQLARARVPDLLR